MPPFDNKDIFRLLLAGESSVHGAHNHLGWETYSGQESSAMEASLTTLHESFHNELNNLTTYGFLLQAYALLIHAGLEQEKYSELLHILVLRCRNAHEIYATFLSTTITAEKKENEGKTPLDHLRNYPNYRRYYEQGRQLTSAFQGNYLKETVLSAIIINCFQSKAIISEALEDFTAFEPGKIRSIEFPDSRLSFLGRRLPPDFLRNSFDSFCQIHAGDQRVDVLWATETNPAYYRVAIASEYDDLQRQLLEHLVTDLAGWFENNGLPTVPFKGNLVLLEQLFSQANILAASGSSGMQLKLNTDPLNIPKNILLNFTGEKYHIRKEAIPAVISPLSAIPQQHWFGLTGGSGENEHFFVISRIGHRVLKQYQLSVEDTAWLNEKLNEPLVFLRRRYYDATSRKELVQLFWLQTLQEWKDFVAAASGIPIISNISLHTWAIPDWEAQWLDALTKQSQCTILFDLPPHNQLVAIFDPSCDQVLLQKVWIKHEEYHHCALVLQGKIQESSGYTPLFFIPAGETTCNVISNYAMNELKEGLFIEGKDFLQENAWLVRITLGHLFNEERIFDFNTI